MGRLGVRTQAVGAALALVVLAACSGEAAQDSSTASGTSPAGTTSAPGTSTTSATTSTTARATTSATTSATATGQVPATEVASVTVVARQLALPWGLARLDDGSYLVSLRDEARVVRVTPEGKITARAGDGPRRPRGRGAAGGRGRPAGPRLRAR